MDGELSLDDDGVSQHSRHLTRDNFPWLRQRGIEAGSGTTTLWVCDVPVSLIQCGDLRENSRENAESGEVRMCDARTTGCGSAPAALLFRTGEPPAGKLKSSSRNGNSAPFVDSVDVRSR